ncbi:MAG: photosystem reaction center subunit [Hyphomicrobiales bacterium]|nr:photosystem reaction center subunit [Hyphomicrobiales bacterium]
MDPTLNPQHHNLIASDRVSGTDVYDRNGEKIGAIERFFIEKVSGRVVYALMSFGGFLGIGEDYYPLPWSKLDYDTNLGGYRVDVSEKDLENAPKWMDGEPVEDRAWAEKVHSHYGVPPYWIP